MSADLLFCLPRVVDKLVYISRPDRPPLLSFSPPQTAPVALNFLLLPAVLLHILRRPLPPSAVLLILLSASRHRAQLWPSQGALAGSHLTGPWPQDDSQHQHVPYMRDKATQVSFACVSVLVVCDACGTTDQCTEVKRDCRWLHHRAALPLMD